MSGSKFQSDVDRLIQEGQQKQQEIEQQTASIVGKQQNDIQKLIEQQQEIQYEKQQNYTEEESSIKAPK